jgi:hypothetical protein
MSPQLLSLFLWMSVLGWGIALGAKLFDLVVVAGAWSAAPPKSLSLLPYGPRFRVNPGHFFLPVSLVVATGAIGGLIAGWAMPLDYRIWLWCSALPVAGLWLVTIPVMWQLNATLQAAGREGGAADRPEVPRAVLAWVVCDWIRVVMVAAGFVAAIRAMSLPIPQ